MKETICALIIDDINHTRQLQGLEASGVDTANAILNISDSVFELVGVANSPFVDEVTKCYCDLVKHYLMGGEPNEKVETFAGRLYNLLEAFSLQHHSHAQIPKKSYIA